MRLSAISGNSTNTSQQEILESLLRLVTSASIDYLYNRGNRYWIGEATEPGWPRQWADRLFVPARQFDERRRARKFLNHLLSLGVPARPWLDAIETPIDRQEGATRMSPPRSAHGAVGYAYMLDPYVVKITGDRSEASKAAHLMDREVSFLTRLHDVWEIAGASGPDQGKRLYAIVQDKVNTGVSGKYRVAGNAVYSFLDRHDRPIGDVEKVAELIVDRYLDKRYRHDAAVVTAITKLLRAIKSVYDSTGVMLQDPHGGNLGFKGQEVSFFDLGRSSRYDDLQPPTPRAI